MRKMFRHGKDPETEVGSPGGVLYCCAGSQTGFPPGISLQEAEWISVRL